MAFTIVVVGGYVLYSVFTALTAKHKLTDDKALMDELDERAQNGALGRMPGYSAETAATFYYALAVDALVEVSA